MASATHSNRHQCHHPITSISSFIQSAASNFSSSVFTKTPQQLLCLPLPASDSQRRQLYLHDSSSSRDSRGTSSSSLTNNMSSESSGSGSVFPSTVRISSLNATGKGGGGPAFVGQVYSMCDLSGTGLMAVSTHFNVPFLSQRTPEWLKKMFAAITKSERKGPVFRFFMDLGDAVSYVKRLNIPSGVVGACRLDLAYEHFKEKPHLFQFVPNERQVKEANKLLKTISQDDGMKKVDGVPVFSAQNLDIAIATTDGIKWYTPYFFDKSMLDNILEESIDRHFHSLIQTRHLQRRRDVIDDNMAADVIEEMGDNALEPPEVQEVMDEMGNPGIPLSVITKAAEIQLRYAVDRVLLGNRWLRKATGIQPKFPYIVDSFERRSTASLLKAYRSSNLIADSVVNPSNDAVMEGVHDEQGKRWLDLRLPFADWLTNPFSKQQQKPELADRSATRGYRRREMQPSPLLPKITMVGVSMGETGQVSKATLKKTMEDLTKELDRAEQGDLSSPESKFDERDPLFVANVGDYQSGATKSGSAWRVRGAN